MNQVAEEILSYFGSSDALREEEELEASIRHSSSDVANEIALYFGIGDEDPDEYLEHYGMPRRSGRYPYGSGDQPFQHSGDFLGRISELKKSGFTYTDEAGKTWTGDNAIAKSMGLTTSEHRRQVSWANYERRCLDVATAKSLKEDVLGVT